MHAMLPAGNWMFIAVPPCFGEVSSLQQIWGLSSLANLGASKHIETKALNIQSDLPSGTNAREQILDSTTCDWGSKPAVFLDVTPTEHPVQDVHQAILLLAKNRKYPNHPKSNEHI